MLRLLGSTGVVADHHPPNEVVLGLGVVVPHAHYYRGVHKLGRVEKAERVREGNNQQIRQGGGGGGRGDQEGKGRVTISKAVCL